MIFQIFKKNVDYTEKKKKKKKKETDNVLAENYQYISIKFTDISFNLKTQHDAM